MQSLSHVPSRSVYLATEITVGTRTRRPISRCRLGRVESQMRTLSERSRLLNWADSLDAGQSVAVPHTVTARQCTMLISNRMTVGIYAPVRIHKGRGLRHFTVERRSDDIEGRKRRLNSCDTSVTTCRSLNVTCSTKCHYTPIQMRRIEGRETRDGTRRNGLNVRTGFA